MDLCGAGWLFSAAGPPSQALRAPVRANSHFGTHLENNSEISFEVLDCKHGAKVGKQRFPYRALTLSVGF